MKYLLIFSFLPLSALAQSTSNLEKYWIYRERLNNFMINGNAAGCVIPANKREDPDNADWLTWGDAPWDLGYWIGNLAMEYDLLVKSGFSPTGPEIMRTKEDLFNAIETVNRLDFVAESDEVWNCGSSLNGFSITDDVPKDFHERIYNGETGVDLLNGSLVPPPDNFRVKCINSAFAQYVIPREFSKDHLVGIYIGLALVKKFIPEAENFNNQPFADNEVLFVTEVQNISSRYISWLQYANWDLFNICENRCVHGTCNLTKPDFCGNLTPPVDPCAFPTNKCLNGGALAKFSAIGFAASNLYIQAGSTNELAAHSLYIDLLHDEDFRVRWNLAIGPGNARLDVTLAALGNIWNFAVVGNDILQSSTRRVAIKLTDKGNENFWEHLIAMHRLFYGTQFDISDRPMIILNSYYECLLDAAPCRGYDGNASAPNTEWGNSDRLAGNRTDPPTPQINAAYNRIDYLFYFNLYCETNPDYLGTSYAPIPIKELALQNIDKNNHTEYDKKNFMASNSITAHDGYIIGNEINGDRGRVSFVAGKYIDLLPGFETQTGSFLDASIDLTIGSMICTEPFGTNCFDVERVSPFDTSGFEEYVVVDSSVFLSNEKSIESILFPDTQPSSQRLLIKPNPNPGVFSIMIEARIDQNAPYRVEVSDMTGCLVYSTGKIPSGASELDLKFLENGVYLLSAVFQDGTRISERIIIIK